MLEQNKINITKKVLKAGLKSFINLVLVYIFFVIFIAKGFYYKHTLYFAVGFLAIFLITCINEAIILNIEKNKKR